MTIKQFYKLKDCDDYKMIIVRGDFYKDKVVNEFNYDLKIPVFVTRNNIKINRKDKLIEIRV